MSKKKQIENKMCTCPLHYVCYMGIICMNRGCGKPHSSFATFGRKDLKTNEYGWANFTDLPKKEQKQYLENPEKFYVVSVEPDGTKHPAWAQKDGSYNEEAYSPA